MKADFSRDTFDPKNHYSRVLMQQGRVQTDADWNEQGAQVEYRSETEGTDMIGACGAPIHHAGFALTSSRQKLRISAGRMYVDGILVENEDELDYLAQPDFPDAPKLIEVLRDAEATEGLVYLDVWHRHITALDDPRIREVALGGPDTTTRAKIVWQVKILSIKGGGHGDPVACDAQLAEWDALTAAPTGLLNTRTSPPQPTADECQIPPSAGYTRLENQLYRVEIHDGGNFPTDAVTFKWSRDNGTVVTLIEKISGVEVTVRDVGPDDVLGFANGQFVEVIDDALELNGKPGQLIKISNVNTATRVISLASAPTLPFDAKRHPKLRRWDSASSIKIDRTWQTLESGVQVQFAQGTFQSGDYWLIPARTAIGEIEWPRDATNAPMPQPRQGIVHHYCRLALVSLANEKLSVTDDCRNLFPPLTAVCAKQTALHVTNTNWKNDDWFPLDQFLKEGLRISFDVLPDLLSLTGAKMDDSSATMIVSAELPSGKDPTTPDLSVVMDGTITLGVNYAQWIPSTLSFDNLFGGLAKLQPFVRLHVELKGSWIWSKTSDKLIYLDGQAFGQPGFQNIRKKPRIDLIFPTGRCATASDFVSWFYVQTGEARQPARPAKVTGIIPAKDSNFTVHEGGSSDAPANIVIEFDKHLQGATVNATTVLVTAANQRVPGNVTYNAANSTAIFVPNQAFSGAASVRVYTVTVRGDGANRIVDADNLVLDGDGDGKAGGNFTSQFTVHFMIG